MVLEFDILVVGGIDLPGSFLVSFIYEDTLKIKIELHFQFDDLAVLRVYCMSQSIVNNEKINNHYKIIL